MRDVKGNEVSMRDLGAFAIGVVFSTMEFANMPKEVRNLILCVCKESGVFDGHLPSVMAAFFRMEEVAAERSPEDNMSMSELIDAMSARLPLIARTAKEALKDLPVNEEAKGIASAMGEFVKRIEGEVQ